MQGGKQPQHPYALYTLQPLFIAVSQCGSLHWGLPLYSILLLGCTFTGELQIDPSIRQIEKVCLETLWCALNMAHSLFNKIQSIVMCVREMVTGSMCGMGAGGCDTEREKTETKTTISFPSSIKLSFSSPLNEHLVTEELIKMATCPTVQLCYYLTSVTFAFVNCLKAVIQQTNLVSKQHTHDSSPAGLKKTAILIFRAHNVVSKVIPREHSRCAHFPVPFILTSCGTSALFSLISTAWKSNPLNSHANTMLFLQEMQNIIVLT